ncbi:MAG: hypothetical protein R2856_10115 [Caldilineaceae bacterium]
MREACHAAFAEECAAAAGVERFGHVCLRFLVVGVGTGDWGLGIGLRVLPWNWDLPGLRDDRMMFKFHHPIISPRYTCQ